MNTQQSIQLVLIMIVFVLSIILFSLIYYWCQKPAPITPTNNTTATTKDNLDSNVSLDKKDPVFSRVLEIRPASPVTPPFSPRKRTKFDLNSSLEK